MICIDLLMIPNISLDGPSLTRGSCFYEPCVPALPHYLRDAIDRARDVAILESEGFEVVGPMYPPCSGEDAVFRAYKRAELTDIIELVDLERSLERCLVQRFNKGANS